MNPRLQLLEEAARALSRLERRIVFVGGATVSLHLDDQGAQGVRATKDVDFVVEISGYGEFAEPEEDFRALVFEQLGLRAG